MNHLRRIALLAAAATLVIFPSAARAGYAGKTLMPREYAAAAAKYHSGVGLVKDVAKAGAESHWNLGAWHDNYDLAGVLKSRDCGVDEINIPARQVGTQAEADLRTDSFDPAVWKRVLANSVEAAHKLFISPWTRDGKPTIRMWHPWVAVTSGWAWFREWWVWSKAEQAWVATGRYVQQAIAGVANYLLVIKHSVTRSQALSLARKWADVFKITQGTLGIRDGIVAWISIPPKPSSPPADGVGPRPIPNDGR